MQSEAIPESLKNMLLVMSTACLFGDVTETIAMETKGDVSSIQYTPQYQLWVLSWQRIEKFLPHLKAEIFPAARSAPSSPAVVAQPPVKVESVVLAQQDDSSVTEQPMMTQLPQGESPPAGGCVCVGGWVACVHSVSVWH